MRAHSQRCKLCNYVCRLLLLKKSMLTKYSSLHLSGKVFHWKVCQCIWQHLLCFLKIMTRIISDFFAALIRASHNLWNSLEIYYTLEQRVFIPAQNKSLWGFWMCIQNIAKHFKHPAVFFFKIWHTFMFEKTLAPICKRINAKVQNVKTMVKIKAQSCASYQNNFGNFTDKLP